MRGVGVEEGRSRVGIEFDLVVNDGLDVLTICDAGFSLLSPLRWQLCMSCARAEVEAPRLVLR